MYRKKDIFITDDWTGGRLVKRMYKNDTFYYRKQGEDFFFVNFLYV